jgi:hyperosmotically inducible periplasmic protein
MQTVLRFAYVAVIAVALSGVMTAAEISTLQAYVDTDLCSHLLIGSITAERSECSKTSLKDGSDPVLVRLTNNMVFSVNKPKMIKEYVGQFATVTGELKVKDNKIKLQTVEPLEISSIPAGDSARRLLDARTHKSVDAGVYEKVRHELAMMPYLTVYDFISFTLNEREVILTGWTVRITNRTEAYNRVKDIEGVETVINNIDVLPLGSFDMSIRAGARAALQRHLSRYFWGSGSDIKIVVKNGTIILLGNVTTKTDSDIAYLQCNSVPNAFKVINMLRVTPPERKS